MILLTSLGFELSWRTSKLVAGVPSGQLNCVAKLAANSSAFPGASKTGPCWPFNGRFGGFLLIRDLLIC